MSRQKKINPNAPMQPIKGASYLTGLPVDYIRRGCRDGSIPHIRVGTDYRVNMPLFWEKLNRDSLRCESCSQDL